MRYTADHKKQTHDRIVAEAAQLFRAEGYRGMGVDAVMAAVGLTAGGFYSHFKNKDALLAEVLTYLATSKGVQLLPAGGAKSSKPSADPLGDWLAAYLSTHHRDSPHCGCALPTLAGEVPRQPMAVRKAFTAALRSNLDALASLISDGSLAHRTDTAIAVLASAAGAMLMARAVDDPAFSDHILRVVASATPGRVAKPSRRKKE
ncbi:MAG: TetR/AcrR family transcriptional regulator [Phycisphaerales bacterium]|nr:TetR/AcrR family transcriptional regulator [Phycisphaerales bacterium]